MLLLLPVFFNAQNEQPITTEETQADSILNGAPKIFIDCFFCDVEYMKQNMPFFNYVRDRKFADLHVIGLRQKTGSGGWEESFEYIGQKRFDQMRPLLVPITLRMKNEKQK